jgi:hypothetical protein
MLVRLHLTYLVNNKDLTPDIRSQYIPANNGWALAFPEKGEIK